MGRHSAPRTRAPFTSALTLAVAAALGAASGNALVPPTVTYVTQQPAAQVAEGATYPGRVAEDSPGWDCTMMGDRVCGPDNAQGAAPGLYDQGGVLLLPWSALHARPGA